MTARVAINGFGRIGRAAFKVALDTKGIDVVAINDLTPIENLLYLLKYDTAYGHFDKEAFFDESSLVIDDKKYPVLSEKEPSKIPWNKYDADVVLECTGRFVEDGAAKAHIEGGAKRVIVSAPTKGKEDDVQTFIIGVNSDSYLGQNVISNASCTTNCIAPVMAVIQKEFGVLKSAMTTTHSVTSTQSIVDGPHKDFRRGRAACYNIIPTTTGAAVATTKVIPDLEGKFDGIAMRVPTLIGSISDITALVKKKTTVGAVNKVFEEAVSDPAYKGVLRASYDPIVSSDIIKDPHSAIVDLNMTRVIDGDLVKILAWYDNEWGYASRLIELAKFVVS